MIAYAAVAAVLAGVVVGAVVFIAGMLTAVWIITKQETMSNDRSASVDDRQ